MIVKYQFLAELPFVVNIDDGEYKIHLDLEDYSVHITNNYYGAINGILGEASGKSTLQIADLNTLNSNKKLTSYIKLRTVVSLIVEKDIPIIDIQEDIIKFFVRIHLIQDKFKHLGDEKYINKLKTEYNKLPKNKKQQIFEAAKIFNAVRINYPDEEIFLRLINKFIQCYMLSFKSGFVEEITFAQLGYSVLNGIIKNVYDINGQLLDAITHVGKVPFFVRKKWYDYSDDEKTEFYSMLMNNEINQVELLIGRARILFEHGILRSAILEANAAMELSVRKRILTSMISKGKSIEDAEKFLKKNQNFKLRCDEIFNNEVGFSLMKNDNTLWSNVDNYRKSVRHLVAHSEKELNIEEAKNAIDCFAKFAKNAQELNI